MPTAARPRLHSRSCLWVSSRSGPTSEHGCSRGRSHVDDGEFRRAATRFYDDQAVVIFSARAELNRAGTVARADRTRLPEVELAAAFRDVAVGAQLLRVERRDLL